MTDFALTHPGGWPANSTVSSAEITDLDAKTKKALNRFGGNIAVGAGPDEGRVHVNAGAAIEVDAGGTILLDGTATMSLGGTSAILLADASSINIDSAAGIDFTAGSLNMRTGTEIALNAGALLQMGGQMDVETGGELIVDSGGVLRLTDQFPLLAIGHPGRTRTVTYDLARYNGAIYGVGWLDTIDGLTAPATSAPVEVILDPPHDGAVLASIDVYFTPAAGHAGLPTNAITVAARRRSPVTGAALPSRSTLGSPVSYSPVSLGDYNDGKVKKVMCTPRPTVDVSVDCFSVQIIGENGTNSIAGCVFHVIKLHYVVADMRFT